MASRRREVGVDVQSIHLPKHLQSRLPGIGPGVGVGRVGEAREESPRRSSGVLAPEVEAGRADAVDPREEAAHPAVLVGVRMVGVRDRAASATLLRHFPYK